MDDEKSLQKAIDEETGASIAYWKRRDRQVQAQEQAWGAFPDERKPATPEGIAEHKRYWDEMAEDEIRASRREDV